MDEAHTNERDNELMKNKHPYTHEFMTPLTHTFYMRKMLVDEVRI